MAAVCDTQAAGSIGRTGSPSGMWYKVEEEDVSGQSIFDYILFRMNRVLKRLNRFTDFNQRYDIWCLQPFCCQL